MLAEQPEGSLLSHTYRRFAPETEQITRGDIVVGFGGVTGGGLLGVVAGAAYLYAQVGGVERYAYWALREFAFGSGLLCLALVLAGIIVALVGRTDAGWSTALGLFLCLVAVGLFAYGYPTDWNVTTPPDYSTAGASIYTLGVGLLAGRLGGVVR